MSLALRTQRVIGQAERPADDLASARNEAGEYDDGLLAIAGPILLLCYVLFF